MAGCLFSSSSPLSLHLVSVVRDEPHYCGVIGKFKEGVAVVRGGAVMGVEGIEQGTQHAALRGASADAEGRGCMGAQSYPLSAVC